MDSHRRTLAKTLTWRLIATLITVVIVYIYNRNVKEAAAVGLVANFIKMALYYVHERFWNNISYGRKTPDYQI